MRQYSSRLLSTTARNAASVNSRQTRPVARSMGGKRCVCTSPSEPHCNSAKRQTGGNWHALMRADRLDADNPTCCRKATWAHGSWLTVDGIGRASDHAFGTRLPRVWPSVWPHLPAPTAALVRRRRLGAYASDCDWRSLSEVSSHS